MVKMVDNNFFFVHPQFQKTDPYGPWLLRGFLKVFCLFFTLENCDIHGTSLC